MTTCLDRLRAFLSDNGIQAEPEHHPETFTAQAMAAALHEKSKYIAKVFIAWADGDLVMFVLPANARVDLSRAQTLLKCQTVRPAREEEFSTVFPDCEVGAMPPFGSFYQLPVYFDSELATRPYFLFAAGTHRDTLRMFTSDYLRLVAPVMADFVLHEPEPADTSLEQEHF